MRIGQYVRCPIIYEKYDEDFPRNFILGKIIDIDTIAKRAEVEFYDLSDCEQFYEHIFQNNSFPLKKLRRCFAANKAIVETGDEEYGYVISHGFDSKSKEKDEDCFYYICLDNGTIKKYYESELSIDCISLDYSPLSQICEYEFQNPSWYAQRFPVSSNMYFIENMVYGFKILSGCRTFLMAHQIHTITRVFETMPIRYMLADEVGLGKTIEAGAIIKIMSNGNLDFRALYIVPSSLLKQWTNEMKYKFNIDLYEDNTDDFINVYSANHYIVSYEKLLDSNFANIILLQKWDIIVSDEIHKILKNKRLYKIIFNLSKITSNVLLLSATPIQDRKKEYLDLLSLLNPSQYENMELAEFKMRIGKQERIQRFVNKGLRYLKNYDDYKEEFFDFFEDLLEIVEDINIKDLISKFDCNSKENGKNIVEQVLSYISENYRIEKRIIRNRRDIVSECTNKRILFQNPYEQKTSFEDFNERNTYEALIQYLNNELSIINNQTEDYFVNIVMPLLSACFSSPWALEKLIEKFEIKDSSLREKLYLWKAQSKEEFDNANELLDETPEYISGRILKVVNFIEYEIGASNLETEKIVVFSNFEESLKQLSELLDLREISHSIFYKSLSLKEQQDSVYEFQNNNKCRVILCDESGGEGRNFQNADWIIHLDLPWTVNAIEQRIGRLDRLGRNSKHLKVKSVVFYTKDTIEEQLFKVWNESFDIFRNSLSGMEIISSDLNNMIFNALRTDLHHGLLGIIKDLHEKVELVRNKVKDEQDYDSATEIYKPLKRFIEESLKHFNSKENNLYQSAMLSWATQSGLYPSTNSNSNITTFNKNKFSIKAAVQTLLIPPDWSLYENTPIVRRLGSIQGTFDRETAIKKEDYIFYAPSDPVFESITSNAVNSGRGRCCAFALYGEYNYSGLIFVYNIEPNVNYLLAHNVSTRLLSKFKMYLPSEQCFIPIPFKSSESITKDQFEKIISNRSNIFNSIHFGERKESANEKSEIKKFIENHPPEKWTKIIEMFEQKALLKANEYYKEFYKKEMLERDISRIINGYESEYLYLNKNKLELNDIKLNYKAIEYSLSHPVFNLDSICFIKVVKK